MNIGYCREPSLAPDLSFTQHLLVSDSCWHVDWVGQLNGVTYEFYLFKPSEAWVGDAKPPEVLLNSLLDVVVADHLNVIIQ